MRVLRTAMVDFQTEEDLKEYVAEYKSFTTAIEHLEQVVIYQTGPTSIQAIVICEDDEALQKNMKKPPDGVRSKTSRALLIQSCSKAMCCLITSAIGMSPDQSNQRI